MPARTESHGRGLDFATVLKGVIFILVGVLACLSSAQSDTFWHLRAGQDFWHNGEVTLTDTYSHTNSGAYWPNHAWLWQAAAYPLFRVGGFPLLTAVNAVIVIAAVGLAFGLFQGNVRRKTVLLALCLLPLSGAWSLRPQSASLLLLVILVRLIAHERYWWIPPLFILWANIHGSVIYGGFLLAVATGLVGILWVRSRTAAHAARLRTLALVTGLSALGTLLTPLGPRLWSYVVESIPRSRENTLQEWTSAFQWGVLPLSYWLWASALVVAVALRWHRLRSWPECVVVAMALAMLPLGASALRNIAPFLLVALPAMIALVAPAPQPAIAAQKSVPFAVILGITAAAGLAIVLFAWGLPLPALGWRPVPEGAVAALRTCPGPLYNTFYQGGFLIWLTPDVPVFVDNRQDPYPQEFLQRTFSAEHSGNYHELFADYGVACAALPSDSPTAARLAGDGWLVAFEDADWYVFYAPVASVTDRHG